MMKFTFNKLRARIRAVRTRRAFTRLRFPISVLRPDVIF